MTIKRYYAFPRALALMEPHYQIVSYQGHSLRESYLYAKFQSVYFATEAERAK